MGHYQPGFRAGGRHGTLWKELNLYPGECLYQLVTRVVPVIESICPDGKIPFLRYYGLLEYPITTIEKIVEETGLKKKYLLMRISQSREILEETVRVTRRERVMPDAHTVWPVTDFFTLERGLQAGLTPRMINHIRKTIRIEACDFPTVGDICKETEQGILAIQRLSKDGMLAIKAMLATANLTLASS
jgi:hypothetical protein